MRVDERTLESFATLRFVLASGLIRPGGGQFEVGSGRKKEEEYRGNDHSRRLVVSDLRFVRLLRGLSAATLGFVLDEVHARLDGIHLGGIYCRTRQGCRCVLIYAMLDVVERYWQCV